MTRRSLGALLAGLFGLSAARSAAATPSSLAHDIPVAAEWIARALNSSGYRADFTMGSIKEIERFFASNSIEGKAIAGGLLSEDLGSRLFALGSYCGETLRRAIGGRWLTDDSDPQGEVNVALELDNGMTCWPVQRVMKRFQSADDSLVHWADHLQKS